MGARRYEFIKKVGEGGWGEVWKARDSQLRRIVAIKLFFPGGSAIASAEGQAAALARVSNRHVVTVFDVLRLDHPVEEDERDALVMEFIGGPTLDELINKGRMTVELGDEIIRGILGGIQALHDEGVIHMDLSTHNIMLTSEGVPKILDVLYAGTVAGRPQLRDDGIRTDAKHVVREVVNVLTQTHRFEEANVFARLARTAGNVADINYALQQTLELPSSAVEAKHLDRVDRMLARREAAKRRDANAMEQSQRGEAVMMVELVQERAQWMLPAMFPGQGLVIDGGGGELLIAASGFSAHLFAWAGPGHHAVLRLNKRRSGAPSSTTMALVFDEGPGRFFWQTPFGDLASESAAEQLLQILIRELRNS
ncbi:MAG: protein kinase [Alphaproteobacteria bacterium]|nr:protein kinase [Alphaproteobacteria bacterium]